MFWDSGKLFVEYIWSKSEVITYMPNLKIKKLKPDIETVAMNINRAHIKYVFTLFLILLLNSKLTR